MKIPVTCDVTPLNEHHCRHTKRPMCEHWEHDNDKAVAVVTVETVNRETVHDKYVCIRCLVAYGMTKEQIDEALGD